MARRTFHQELPVLRKWKIVSCKKIPCVFSITGHLKMYLLSQTQELRFCFCWLETGLSCRFCCVQHKKQDWLHQLGRNTYYIQYFNFHTKSICFLSLWYSQYQASTCQCWTKSARNDTVCQSSGFALIKTTDGDVNDQ